MDCRLIRRTLINAVLAVTAGTALAAASEENWVVATNQANQTIECYDRAQADWNAVGAVAWRFTPRAPDYTSAEVVAAKLPSDARFRRTDFWSGTDRVLVAVTSGGLATITSYPEGRRVWGAIVGGNPHAGELLPDGNLAVAASHGNWVRVYASSQGAHSTRFAEFVLEDAHAALWDPAIERLWVLGRIPGGADVLTALKVGGTAAEPTLDEDRTRRYPLPTPGPHDLSPYLGDPAKLWVTTVGHGYVFDKRTGVFQELPGAADGRDTKALSNAAAGPLVQTRKKPGGCYDWTTDTVLFHDPHSGASQGERVVRGGCFYKARAWTDLYQ